MVNKSLMVSSKKYEQQKKINLNSLNAQYALHAGVYFFAVKRFKTERKIRNIRMILIKTAKMMVFYVNLMYIRDKV